MANGAEDSEPPGHTYITTLDATAASAFDLIVAVRGERLISANDAPNRELLEPLDIDGYVCALPVA